MRTIIFIAAFFSVCDVFSAETVELDRTGVWPSTLSRIGGTNDKTSSIVFSAEKPAGDKDMIWPTTIQIDENTVVYVPKDAKIHALPRTYTAPELAHEVKRFYREGLGSYTFWAILIGVAVLSR